MALANYYNGIINSYPFPVQGNENQMGLYGGAIKPAGSGTPTAATVGSSRWTVSRTGTGIFLVTLIGNFGKAGTIAKINSLRTCLQIDPAASTLTLASTIGAVTGNTFVINVWNTETNALADITQPGSPTNQGSFIHWSLLASNDNTQVLYQPSFSAIP